jgi:hypothetical protein
MGFSRRVEKKSSPLAALIFELILSMNEVGLFPRRVVLVSFEHNLKYFAVLPLRFAEVPVPLVTARGTIFFNH